VTYFNGTNGRIETRFGRSLTAFDRREIYLAINALGELINFAEKRNQKISSIVKEQKAKEQRLSEQELTDKMLKFYEVMKQSANRGVFEQVHSISGITGGEGYKLWQATKKGLSGSNVLKASARAMAVSNVNASMGKIVAAPTAGSCGIIPGALITVAEELKKRDEVDKFKVMTAAEPCPLQETPAA
jgi:L-serine dehydratase